MPTSALTKYNAFIDEVSKGGHNLAATDVYKCALTNTAPTVATDTVWNTTVAPAPAAANGYTAGGNTLTSSGSTTSSVFKMLITDTVFTATAGGIGPFRYAIIYNSTKSNKVVGFYDYASPLTLASGETLTVDFDGTNGALTLS